jgi:hypothetical protein
VSPPRDGTRRSFLGRQSREEAIGVPAQRRSPLGVADAVLIEELLENVILVEHGYPGIRGDLARHGGFAASGQTGDDDGGHRPIISYLTPPA